VLVVALELALLGRRDAHGVANALRRVAGSTWDTG
jgi:hypothetical protein